MKTVLATLLLLLWAAAAWAQAAFISFSGDYGDIGSTITDVSGAMLEEPAQAPPAADEVMPFDFEDCPPATVEANVVFGDAVVAAPLASLSLTARAIEGRRNNMDAAGDPGAGFLILGDYRPNLVLSVSYRLRVARRLDNSLHACVRELDVSATFAPVITIAREIAHGSCLEREVLAHERGHWAIDNAAVPELRLQLDEAAVAGAGAGSGFEGETLAELQSRVSAALHERLDGFVSLFNTSRQARQAAHDSPEEHERIDQACGRAAADVAARVRGEAPALPAP